MQKKTLVLGASLRDMKYSNTCVRTLQSANIPVVAIGIKEGNINSIPVVTGFQLLTDIQTVTLYLGPENQKMWYEYIIGLKPERVIFNPGTENYEFINLLKTNGISVIEDCTLMMVQYGRF